MKKKIKLTQTILNAKPEFPNEKEKNKHTKKEG